MTTTMTITEARAALAAALDARVIPFDQLASAAALAAHFGHEWANGWNMDLSMFPADGITIGEIRAMTRADRHDSMPGIEAPEMDDDGVIRHTTTTGRLSWRISPDGEILFEISRPGDGSHISAIRRTSGELEVLDVVGEVFYRHFDALKDAFEAFVAPETAEEVIAPAREAYIHRQVERFERELREQVEPREVLDPVIEPLPEPTPTL